MPKIILIIDDDQGIREALKELLEIEGFRVETAASGTDGLNALRSFSVSPALVLVDLMMPGMGGLEFRSQQLEHKLFLETPVILMSADGQMEKRGESSQFTGYLRKPMDINQVLDLAKKYCES
jgi:CheY-like chemotaxis protein